MVSVYHNQPIDTSIRKSKGADYHRYRSGIAPSRTKEEEQRDKY